jgi:hypothetical protein
MDFDERYPGMATVLDFIDAPIRAIIGGIKMLLYFLLFAAVAIALPVYCLFHGGYVRRNANAGFLVQPQRYVYQVDFRHPLPASFTPFHLNYDVESPHPINAPFTAYDEDSGKPVKPELYFDFGCDNTTVWNHTDIGKWWSFRMNVGDFDDLQWAKGKQAPMYAALVRASIMASRLHQAIAESKDNNYSYKPGLCRAQFDPRIKLPDAPVLTMAYVQNVGSGSAIQNDRLQVLLNGAPAFLVLGMCPRGKCTSADLQYVPNRDILTSSPEVTDGQAAAIAALDYMSTDEFWLKEAHANGVPSSRDFAIQMYADMARSSANNIVAKPPNMFKTYVRAVCIVYTPIFLLLYIIYRWLRWAFRSSPKEQERKRRLVKGYLLD